jgi:hypothetical protein
VDLAPAIAVAVLLPAGGGTGQGEDDVFAMRPADASQPGILMRVQTWANLTDGSQVQVQATVDPTVSSSLVLVIAHFEGTLYYDPGP